MFIDVPKDELKAEIRELAKAEVVSGEITAEQYEQYIGEVYVPDVTIED